MGHRRGRGQVLSADQLASLLAIPCYYILLGKATPAFPETAVPGPSSFVQVIQTGQVLSDAHIRVFPVYVNWRQWREVLVPVLEDERWLNYLGRTGGGTNPGGFGIPGLGNDDGSGEGTGSTPGAGLGAGLFDGSIGDWIELLEEAIRGQAIEEGYGTPDQEPLPEGAC
jgi:hypothetical protein